MREAGFEKKEIGPPDRKMWCVLKKGIEHRGRKDGGARE
jgi:hypothetical protein